MTALLLWCAGHSHELLVIALCGLAVLIAVFAHTFSRAVRREVDYHADLHLMRKMSRENHEHVRP